MTKDEFRQLPLLIQEHHVMEASGYARNTVRKLVDCGVLRLVKPKGCHQGRFQKRQVARLLKWEEAVETDALKREPALMLEKSVRAITGYSTATLDQLVAAGALSFVRPAGISVGRFRKAEIARLVGFEEVG